MTHKEFDLLAELMRNKGVVISRDLLLQKVWGYDYVGDSRTVDVHIRWLREKIEDNPSVPKRITTVRAPGIGLKAKANDFHFFHLHPAYHPGPVYLPVPTGAAGEQNIEPRDSKVRTRTQGTQPGRRSSKPASGGGGHRLVRSTPDLQKDRTVIYMNPVAQILFAVPTNNQSLIAVTRQHEIDQLFDEALAGRTTDKQLFFNSRTFRVRAVMFEGGAVIALSDITEPAATRARAA